MQIVAPVRFISALFNALRRRAPGPPTPAAGRIVQRALADGWITPFGIECLLVETDPRLWQISTRELLRVFEVPLQHVFERPTRGARDAEGLERVSVVELARLLILLERAGLTVDPVPLCAALAPSLGAKRLLTTTELLIYWRAQRRPEETLTFSAGSVPDCVGCETFTTAAGYTVRGYFENGPDADIGDEPDCIEMLSVEPPPVALGKAAKVRSTAARRHLRKYLGEPRAGRSPARKPRPTPAA